MEQTLHYRGITYVIGIETDGMRSWSVHGDPDGPAPQSVLASGVARARGLRGSFKGAVMAARDAIDERLGAELAVEPVGVPDPAVALG